MVAVSCSCTENWVCLGFFNLLYFSLDFICCFFACLNILLQSFITMKDWFNNLYCLQGFFSPCCLPIFRLFMSMLNSIELGRRFLLLSLNQLCVGTLLSLPWHDCSVFQGLGRGGRESIFVTLKALTVRFGISWPVWFCWGILLSDPHLEYCFL